MNFRVVQQRHTGIRRPLPCHKAPPLTLTRIPEDVRCPWIDRRCGSVGLMGPLASWNALQRAVR